MSENMKAILISLVTGFYIYIVTEIYKAYYLKYDETIIIFALSILTFFILIILFSLNRLLLDFKFYRRLFENKLIFEGSWLLDIQTSQNDRYGIASLYYDKYKKKYVYEGTTYDENFLEIAQFNTENLAFIDNDEIIYTYTAEKTKKVKSSHGIGYIKFSNKVNGKFTNITDKFFSLTSNKFNNYTCKLYLYDKKFKESISNEPLNEQIEKLVNKYIK